MTAIETVHVNAIVALVALIIGILLGVYLGR